MKLTLAVESRLAADELRSLREWLVADEELRGRVRLSEAAPAPGTLGSVVDTLVVALGPGGVATATASVLIAWIRRRKSDVTIKGTRQDGSSFELHATNVPELGELAKLLSGDERADG